MDTWTVAEEEEFPELVDRLRKVPGVGNYAERAAIHICDEEGPNWSRSVLNNEPESWDELVRMATRFADRERTYDERTRTQAPSRLSDDDEAVSLLSEPERMRAEAAGFALADVASRIPRIVQFRNEVLANRLLGTAEALAFLRSPALERLTAKEIEAAGAPVVGHDAIVIDGPKRLSEGPVSIRISPPGVVITKDMSSLKPVIMPIPVEGKRTEKRTVYAKSVLSDLWTLTYRLASWYWWQWDEAMLWVITGKIPSTPAVRSEFHGNADEAAERATITLSIDPWVSPESVERVYRAMRKKYVSGGFRDWDRGRPLDVFRFVAEQRASTSETLIWRALLDRWESAHPDRSYGGNTRNFQRDYVRARNHLLWPYEKKLRRPYPRSVPEPWMW